MAFETYAQIQDAFKSKDGNQDNIQKAIQLQQRLRFHSDYSQFKLNGNYWGKGAGMARKEAPKTMSEAQNDFLELVGLLLNPSQNETSGKFQVFSYLYTNRNSSIVEMMKDEDQRIFTAKDATEDIIVNADNEKAKEKIYEETARYRSQYLKDNEWFAQKGLKSVYTAPNNIIVIEIGNQKYKGQTSPRFRRIELEDTKVVKTNKTLYGNDLIESIEYIYFIGSYNNEQAWFVYDDENYYVFKYQSGDESDFTENSQLEKIPHRLTNSNENPICPATFISHEASYDGIDFFKKSRIEKQLPLLDELLLHEVSYSYYDLYGKFPIVSTLEFRNDYEDSTNEPSNNFSNEYDDQNQTSKSEFRSAFNGAGSLISVPVITDESGKVVSIKASDAVAFIEPSDTLLEYNQRKTERLIERIEYETIGLGAYSLKQAMNPDQISMLKARKETLLRQVAKDLSKTHRFVLECALKLRDNRIVEVVKSYGTDFYLTSVENIVELYNSAKNSGLTDSLLTDIRRQAIGTKYRTQPMNELRLLRLDKLEPLSGLSTSELNEQYTSGLISQKISTLKSNFTQCVDIWEQENGRIEKQSEFNLNAIFSELLEISNTYFLNIQTDSNESNNESEN